jgi:hypothetical protein
MNAKRTRICHTGRTFFVVPEREIHFKIAINYESINCNIYALLCKI